MKPSVSNISSQYGTRGRRHGFDTGVRKVAPTYGKARYLVHSLKASGIMSVESDAERLVAHLLTLDPAVRSFAPQPFTVDLIDRRILRSPELVKQARHRHRGRIGQKFYTPDFLANWTLGGSAAIELKLEGYEGNANDQMRIARGRDVIEASGMQFLQIVWPKSNRNPMRINVPMLAKAKSRMDLWPGDDLIGSVSSALEQGARTVHDLCRAISLDPNVVPMLLVSGVLAANVLERPINGAMAVTSADGDLAHLSLLRKVSR